MPHFDLNQRVVVADSRLASIDRHLGLLKLRLYYQVESGPLQEIEVFSHTYKGRGSDAWKDGSGTDPQAETHSVVVNRLMWQDVTSEPGQYFIRLENGAELQPCSPDSQIGQSAETTAKLELKVTKPISTYL